MDESQHEPARQDHVAHSVILVRHGRTSYNAAGRIQGHVDIPLDEQGRWQVEQTGRQLRSLYVGKGRGKREKELVVASDLDRAAATAHAFADELGVDINFDERFRERSFGEWEGKAVDDLKREWPQDCASWLAGFGGELKHGAETKHHVGQRGEQALTQWVQRATPDTDLYVFSHGAWISQTLQEILGLSGRSEDFMSMVSPRNAFWSRLAPMVRDDGTIRWRLLEFNHGPVIAQELDWDRERR
ncbi:MAG: histidine phosphatase family protein [Bifidobacteriaceae bacterium]|jgi:2,3-bisphosphoglycerate-dependent phosphoglycerate mutase|nr:histidine phosphatase family protein [Bifidobacteriaceae bacterium]MCI1914998.1 histidine phosphatase family protein [Bifidobacteriaceae bacterium]